MESREQQMNLFGTFSIQCKEFYFDFLSDYFSTIKVGYNSQQVVSIELLTANGKKAYYGL
jgi:hypothetical protein